MNFDRLREQILERAIQGKLVPQLESEPGVAQITGRPKEPPFAIPEKWKWAQLKNVGKIVGGGTPKTNIAENWENGQILWFTPSDLGKVRGLYAETSARKITLTGLHSSAATMMPKDTVLFSSRAPIGHIALAPADCCTNQGCKSFVANSSYILPLWAYWVLVNRKDDIISRASGTTFKEISLKGMSETWIPVPPIQEQRRIVGKIQKLLRFVDSAETAFQDLQSLSGILHRRVLHLAIQGRLVPQLESEPEVEQIGEAPEDVPFAIPEKWKWILFSDAVKVISSRPFQIKAKEVLEQGLYPVISQSKEQIDGYSNDDEKLVPDSDLPIIVFGDHTRILKYVDFRFVVGADGTKLLHVKISSIDPKYFYIALQSMIGQTRQRGYGRHFQFLKVLHIPIPPIEEQRRIVAKLNDLFDSTSQLERTISTP